MSKNKPIGIVAKEKEALALDVCEKLLQWIAEKGVDYRIDEAAGRTLGSKIVDKSKVLSRELFTKTCDPIVVLGGDGTLLSVCRHPSEFVPTVIGVNFGTLGFLAEVRLDELFSTLESVLAGKATTEKRMLLEAQVFRNKKLIGSYAAFNDVVLTKEALARIFAVEILINDNLAAQLRGDGVIISTPSGSTAYSLAAGGSIIHPQVNALLITPICPHSLTSRPLVVPGEFAITLKIEQEQSGVYLTVDGQSGMPLEAGDCITVKTANAAVLFAKSKSSNYFKGLGEKLKWSYT